MCYFFLGGEVSLGVGVQLAVKVCMCLLAFIRCFLFGFSTWYLCNVVLCAV